MNNQLIKTSTNEQNEVIVSGRELHVFLEVATPYKKWFDRMCEYGFAENTDFVTVGQKCPIANGGYQERTDHAIKLDMAKEISMIQRSEKGKQARQYFIQIEKLWNSPEMIMKRALEIANERVKQAEETIHKLMHSGKLYTASEIAKECGMSAVRLNKFLCEKGIQYKCNGTYLLYSKYENNGYVSIKQFQKGEITIYDRKFTDKGRLFILELLDRHYPTYLETKQNNISMVLN